jgi:hypothetical protein
MIHAGEGRCEGAAEEEGKGKLKIGRLHSAGGSLAEVISAGPAWWTPTAKAEAIVGIMLALRFAHGLGVRHSGLNSGNVLFDHRYTSGNNVFGKVRKKSIFLRRIAYLHQFLLDAVIFEA